MYNYLFTEYLPEAGYSGNQIKHYLDWFLRKAYVTTSPFEDEIVDD